MEGVKHRDVSFVSLQVKSRFAAALFLFHCSETRHGCLCVNPFIRTKGEGSAHILGDLTYDYAYSLATLNKKNFISVTPLKSALNAFNFALNDSAAALVCLATKKFRILS